MPVFILCRISFFSGLRPRMPADRSCNRMFTAGISRNHNNRTSSSPSLIHSSLMLLSLRNGMSAKRISLNHDTSPYTHYIIGYRGMKSMISKSLIMLSLSFPASRGGSLPLSTYSLMYRFNVSSLPRMPACRSRSTLVPSSRSNVWRAWDCSCSERRSVVMNLESRSMSSKVTPLARCGSGRST